MSAPEIERRDFERYFPYTPTALCIKECARLSALRRHECRGPILDVGCGDGLFARMAFDSEEVWGIDIDANEGRWAAASSAYSQVILGDVTRARLPGTFFSTCIANCSLEHVPRIDLALRNIAQSLRPGGKAYLFVPNKDWARKLLSYRLLEGIGQKDFAEFLRSSVDSFFKHHHLYDEAGWREIVLSSGMDVAAIEPVGSTASTVAFEALLLPSLAGWANKQLTTRWTNFPRFRKAFAAPMHAMVERIMQTSESELTAEYLVIARRRGGDS
jgi:SAM-dependent methyltransferase